MTGQIWASAKSKRRIKQIGAARKSKQIFVADLCFECIVRAWERPVTPFPYARELSLTTSHMDTDGDPYEWTSLPTPLADFARSDPWIPTLKLDPPWGVTVNLMACHRETPSARSIIRCDRESDGVTSGDYVRSRGGRQPPKCAEKYRLSKAAGQRCAVKARGAWRFVLLEGGQPGSSFRER